MTKEIETTENGKNLENTAKEVVRETATELNDAFEQQEEHEDISNYSKEELLKLLNDFKISDNPSKDSSFLKDIKSQFDQHIDNERDQALQKFIESGGIEEDFELKKDQTSQKFEKTFEALKTKIADNYNRIEKERQLTSSEESTTSINILKEIQDEWKKTGPVPSSYSQNLWQSYNALVEMFYNNRSIYFELKELDRKKNLESKKDIVAKAEKLVDKKDVLDAVNELRSLHDEYKHIGPVPKEEQEALWTRFKVASDKVYDKRKEHYASQKQQLEENLTKKESLIQRINPLAEFTTEKIDDWKAKTQEVLALQEEWRKAGRVPKEKAKDTSKLFWAACKTFFNNKNEFFKRLEVQKEANLKLKVELCEQAESLKSNDDFRATANALKDLQKKWEGIGPVPIKMKDEIFKRFKAACDEFFNKRRVQQAEEDKEYIDNLNRKNAIIEKIETLAAKKDKNPEELKVLQDEWKSIGFVPKNDVKKVSDRYNQVVDKFISDFETSNGASTDPLEMAMKLSSLKGNPAADKKIHRTESEIYKRITGLKKEIDQYNTNILFLAKSSKADKLKEEINSKILLAENELKTLEKQLKQLKDA